MELFDHLALGFATALSFENVAYCFIGVLIGTFIGVLPGLGPTATIAMLLPITYYLTPTASLIMLAGIYYGSQYGGSTTAILVNLPGEVSSSVTAIDGYQMARRGEAGKALAIAAIGSFIAGTFATLVIAIVAVPLASLALRFGPPEYFALMLLGLVASTALAHGSVLKAMAMIVTGILFGIVGTDVDSGQFRFTLGIVELTDGLSIVAVALGIFGIAEVLRNLEHMPDSAAGTAKITGLMPTRADLRAAAGPIVRGSLLGSLLGTLPGGGSILSAFSSYMLEKRLSPNPERFGKGAIEGVAGPESANNAGAQTSFIPLLTLGIPAHPLMALMVGALMIQGITPGPNVVVQQPAFFWGVIASMWIGNALLVILNLPLVGLWAKLLKIPFSYLCTGVLIFCVIGAYGLKQSMFDVWVMLGFGILGYLLRKLDFPLAPAILALILGPMMEKSLRTTLEISGGSFAIFLDRPVALALLAVPVIVLGALLLRPRSFSKLRESDID